MALLSDKSRAGGVTFAFTERTGGVSTGAYSSLNLGASQGDDPRSVEENRRRALDALGLSAYRERLLQPRQVHGDRVVGISSLGELERARSQALEGADAIVCTAPEVPVMLLSADCALVVLVCEGGFAVAHSGWRGTIAEISAAALAALCDAAGTGPDCVSAYVGPHIQREDYVVSDELIERFAARFGPGVSGPGSTLDLSFAIRATLREAGVADGRICISDESTASNTNRFFSWRAQGGVCGRNAAIACMREG